MRRIVLGLLVLAICGMMVAPMGLAGKPGGGGTKSYSTLGGDFQAGPSSGSWLTSNALWDVGQSTPLGGPIRVNYPCSELPSTYIHNDGTPYISSSTHVEVMVMLKYHNGNSYLNPKNLPVGKYICPGPIVEDFCARIMLPGWGGTDTLAIITMASAFPGTVVNIEKTSDNHLKIDSSSIRFNYNDWGDLTVRGDWTKATYGYQIHSISFVIDI